MDDSRPQDRSSRRFAAKARPRLVLGGLAVAGAVTLGGCEGTPTIDDAQFTTVAECTSAGYPTDLCQSGYNAAFIEHQRSAPKFNSLKSCESEWGGSHCIGAADSAALSGASVPGANTGVSTGGNVFVPMLAGFVLSRALQQRYYDRGDIGIGYYGGYGGFRGSPIYRSRTGSTVTVDRSSGVSRIKPVNVNTASISRSGFGGMSMSRSSSSGSSWGG